jgi:CubicO group peptidase (beta-lactamase class C family)
MRSSAYAFVVASSLISAGCGDSEPSEPPGTLAERIEARFEDAADDGFSGAALVTIRGERVLERGYGLANREQGTPNTPEIAFDVGSILKDFTAAAIFQLAHDGKVAVRDPLSAIFPDVPPDKSAITVLQVLQHRAGFHEYHDERGDFEPMTRAQARARIFAQDLLFEPGSEERYSNSGFTLLADAVEVLSGQPFTAYVRAALFTPAGMQHSGFYAEPVWERVDTAVGYDAERFGDNDPATWPYTWALVGNGGLVTSVLDLDRWSQAFWDGRVLSPQAVAAMRRDYLSVGSATLDGQTIYAAAGGGDFGLGGVAVDVPEQDTRLFLATNTSEAFDIEDLALELVSLVLEEE